MILCQICNRECKNYISLGQHIKSHGYNAEMYYIEFVSNDNKCKICGKPTRFVSISVGYKPTCSAKCAGVYGKDKRKETCLEKYGTENPAQNIEIRQKISNSIKSEECQEKTKQTNLIKYGVDNVFKRPENQEKARKAYTGKITSTESFIIDYIKTFYNGFINTHDRTYKSELDIYLSKLKIGIEYNGNYWHSYPRKEINYHLNKSLYFKQFNIRLIHIYEFENLNQQLYLLKELINGNDLYNKNDFNKNNLLDIIVKPEPVNTNKGIVYCAGKLY